MRDDRSYRVALVADRYVNPAPGELDGLAVLAAAGWGVMQLPDDGYPADVARQLLAGIAEQVEEFSRHGYAFIVVGERDGLAGALADVGVAVPERIVPGTPAELGEFLAAQPVPPALATLPLDVEDVPKLAGPGRAGEPGPSARGATAAP